MRKFPALVLGLALGFLPVRFAPAQAPIAVVGSRELIEKGRDFDGKTIFFEGEAIGDPMKREGHAWVNILDSNAALGAWLPASLLSQIASYGSYRGKGDRLRVRGVFHRACPDHGGDMDIHVLDLELVSRGEATTHTIATSSLILAPLALLAALGLYFLWRRREAAIAKDLARHEGREKGDSRHRSP